ncbi:MAG: hypothetical protein IIZ70_00160 [Kiritimatiellae bacterium]|nr:hypothetical protein [Kiritimatiellia bacterium]
MKKSILAAVLAGLCAWTGTADFPRLRLDGEKVAIPADWKGRSVGFEQKLAFCEVDVIVNGRKAGTAYAPDGMVEISQFLKFGSENEIKTVERPAVAYVGRGDGSYANRNGKTRVGDAMLVARTPAYVDDFFVRPSWREKKLYVDAEIESARDMEGEVSVFVSDAPGSSVIVKGSKKARLVMGPNVVRVEIEWANPIPWEPVAHPKTYDCRVELAAGGAKCDSNRPSTLFGFREIWHEGREIMLNGHVQRFRGFWNQGVPRDMNDLHKYGYNLSYETHKHWAYLFEDEKSLIEKSKAGVAVFAGMPSIYFVHDAIRSDPKCTEAFRRSLKAWMRTWRNYPAIIAASTGVNQICPEMNMKPEHLGQTPQQGGVVENIEFAANIAREMNPNCLYFSHADGTEADISSSNLYFNFTPLQEREEWLSQWSTNGILPWYAAEFGAPYYACWFHSRVPEMTEWLAAYYGERAYREETEDMLRFSKDFAKDCLRKTHGGWVNGKDLYAFNPLAEEYSRMLVYRTNRAWRYYGLNGGLMYLTSWPWDSPNTMRDRQMQANGDIVTFIGGEGDPTDRTHAYASEAEIRKSLVFIWDGQGDNELTADWKFADASGKTVKSGRESVKLAQGEIRKVPVVVKAPAVKERRSFRFEAVFNARRGFDKPANATVKTDSFDVEVYPVEVQKPRNRKDVAIYDPEGRTAPLFVECGVGAKAFDTLDAAIAAKPKFLVVGWRALSKGQGLEKAASAIESGMRVLVMQQKADVWRLLGFKVEDSMARRMFNNGLAGVDDIDLAHWAGSPIEDVPFGNVMKHETRRGPRWTHHHAVSGTPILIPQRGGFVPLVRGEFDLSYSALLKERLGRGAVYFCAFDFEGRDCPAAKRVFAAVAREFLDGRDVEPAKLVVDGAHAERIAKTMGLDCSKYGGKSEKDAVLLVGRDSRLSADVVKGWKGPAAMVVANDAIADSIAGLGEKAEFYRGRAGDHLMRSRDGIEYRPFKDGSAVKKVGRVLLDQLDPFQCGDRYRSGDGKAAKLARGGWGSVPKGDKDLLLRNASQSEDNFMRRYSTTLAGFGVGAGAKVFARSLYTKPEQAYDPISQYNVLGPWPSEKDDDHYMVDTIFPVDESKGGDSGRLAEEMAIRGDVQPNPRFHPLGLKYLDSTPKDLWFLDWRPVVKSRDDGFVDYSQAHPLIAAQSFCTCYCVGFFKRREAGEITVRFGVDWRGKIWVNGVAYPPVYGGHKDEGSVIYEHVKVHAGDNYVTVKAGCGQSAKTFWLNISHELQPGEVSRVRVPELDGTDLYETANAGFDPYEYVYW